VVKRSFIDQSAEGSLLVIGCELAALGLGQPFKNRGQVRRVDDLSGGSECGHDPCVLWKLKSGGL
jgi:hypothetical protein